MSGVLQTASGTVFASTSLDPSETNQQRLTKEPAAAAGSPRADRTTAKPSRYSLNPQQAAIHHRWQRERATILDAMDGSTFGPIGKQRTRITLCGLSPLLVITSTGTVAVAPGLCRQRMCPTCQARRGRELSARVTAITGMMNAPRLITLTLKSSTDTLKSQLDRLYQAFRDLRRRDFWKEHVWAGVAVAEITLNTETGLWHPHLHILADGLFMPQSSLSAEWKAVTTDSSIVDIRAVHDRRNAATYIAEYVAKPNTAARWPAAQINEFAWAIHGRRMIITFGKAHRLKLPMDDCETRPTLVEPLCTVATLHKHERHGCPVARWILVMLSRAGGLIAKLTLLEPRPSGHRAVPLEPFEWEWIVEGLRFVAAAEASRATDACPFPDAETIAASPPVARQGPTFKHSGITCTERVSVELPS